MMQTVHFVRFDCAYDCYGQGAPLVLVHGFPLDSSIWEPLRPHLEPYFRVIELDLPGFGGSSVLQDKSSVAGFAHAVARLVKFLGNGPAYVAGHSMGGYVALELARLYPSDVRGLGLISTQALPDTPERRDARYASIKQVEGHGLGEIADNMSAKLSANPQHAPALKELILRQPSKAVTDALAAMAERPDFTPLLSGFNFPVSIVHGLADVLIPPERSREMKTVIPNATLTELPGVGHMPMLEAPKQTALALRSLLAQ